MVLQSPIKRGNFCLLCIWILEAQNFLNIDCRFQNYFENSRLSNATKQGCGKKLQRKKYTNQRKMMIARRFNNSKSVYVPFAYQN